jgi:uncharacterized membrane protein
MHVVFGLLIWAMPFELNGAALVGGWVLLTTAAILMSKWSPLAYDLFGRSTPGDPLANTPGLGSQIGLHLPAILAYGLALLHLFTYEYAPIDINFDWDHRFAFAHERGLALGILLLGTLLPGFLAGRTWQRFAIANGAIGLLLWAMPFEFSGPGLIFGWIALIMLALVADRWPPLARIAVEHSTAVTAKRSQFAFAGNLGMLISAAAAGTLSVLHLLSIEYPITYIASDRGHGVPFLGWDGLAFWTLMLIGVTFSLQLLKPRATALCVLFAVMYVLPFETSEWLLPIFWCVVALAAMAAGRWNRLDTPGINSSTLPGSNTGEPAATAPSPRHRFLHGPGMELPALAAWALAILHFFTIDLPDGLARGSTPFVDTASVVVAAIVAVAVFSSFATRIGEFQIGWRSGSILLVAAFVPFEVQDSALVVLWAGLALVAITLTGRGRDGDLVYQSIAAGLGGLAAVVALLLTPPTRLVVDRGQAIDHPFLWSGATAAFAALAVTGWYAARRIRNRSMARWLIIAAGACVVYLVSVGVVDLFQGQVGEGIALESLQKRAQVALSILWATIGGGVFVLGIFRFRSTYRLSGLVLLAIATIKVFIWDMAKLDASYRVLSLIGLGILLLASSWLYQRHVKPLVEQGDDQETDDDTPPPDPSPTPGHPQVAGA